MYNKKLIIGMMAAVIVIAVAIYIMSRKVVPAKTTIPVIIPAGQEEPASIPTGIVQDVKNMGTSVYNWITGTSETIADNPAAFPLKSGSQGAEVKALQTWLNNYVIVPYAPITEDGIFGVNTAQAVQRTINVTEVSEAWYKAKI